MLVPRSKRTMVIRFVKSELNMAITKFAGSLLCFTKPFWSVRYKISNAFLVKMHSAYARDCVVVLGCPSSRWFYQ